LVQLVEALPSKLEGRRFDSQWCHWTFSLTYSGHTVALGQTQPLNRNEYQEYCLGVKGRRCIGLTTLTPSCADCHEIWESQPPRTLWACPGIVLPFLSFIMLSSSSVRVTRSAQQYHFYCMENTSVLVSIISTETFSTRLPFLNSSQVYKKTTISRISLKSISLLDKVFTCQA
jgi:hypothetical protein